MRRSVGNSRRQGCSGAAAWPRPGDTPSEGINRCLKSQAHQIVVSFRVALLTLLMALRIPPPPKKLNAVHVSVPQVTRLPLPETRA